MLQEPSPSVLQNKTHRTFRLTGLARTPVTVTRSQVFFLERARTEGNERTFPKYLSKTST